MPHDELFKRSKLMAMSMAQAVKSLWPDIGETFFEVGGTYAIYSGPGSPLTQANGSFTPEELIQVQNFYRGRVENWEAIVTPFVNPSAFQGLLDLHPSVMNWENVFLHDLKSLPPKPPLPKEAEIIVVGPDNLKLWSETARKGFFGLDETPISLKLSRIVEQMDSTTRYLVKWNDEPVAAASLSIYHGMAFLGGMATAPAYRRQGLQSALLYRRLRDAAGCQFATMGAIPSETSERNALRLGFQIAYTQLSLSIPVV